MPEIPSTILFRRTYALSVGFKMKLLKEKAFSCVMVKINSNYAAKVAKRSNSSLPIYLINDFVQTSILFNMSLKVHLCRFEVFTVCSASYINNTLKISHS